MVWITLGEAGEGERRYIALSVCLHTELAIESVTVFLRLYQQDLKGGNSS